MNKIQVIIARSILGLKPNGVEKLSEAILNSRALRNSALFSNKIEVPHLNHQYSSVRDPVTQCLNPQSVHEFSRMLAKTVSEQIDNQNFSLILGGDCSILIGIMAALKQKGRFALVFLDAHSDFYAPHQSPTGEIADMDLAIVAGRGPEILTDIDSLGPYVNEQDIYQVGQRDQSETIRYGADDISETAINIFDLSYIRKAGVKKVTDEITNRLYDSETGGFWIHFDADVISDAENPAVDYRLPGGLTFDEVEHLISGLTRLKQCIGISLTIYNPTLDVDGRIAEKIGTCLLNCLT